MKTSRVSPASDLSSPLSGSLHSPASLPKQQHCSQVVMVSDCPVSCHTPRRSQTSPQLHPCSQPSACFDIRRSNNKTQAKAVEAGVAVAPRIAAA